MSWVEPYNGVDDVEENPDPEEDSDLPSWQHRDEEAVRREEEEPEEDLGISGDVVAAPDNVHESASNRERDRDHSVSMDHARRVEHENSENANDIEDNNDMINDQHVDPPQANHMGEANGVREASAEGDSFEQDEEAAAPECENEVRQEACSESDRQLLHLQGEEEMADSRDAGRIDGNNLPEEQAESIERERENLIDGERQGDSAANSNDENVSIDGASSHPEDVNIPCAFSGNVLVAHNMDDAPEAEICDMQSDLVADSVEQNISNLIGDQVDRSEVQGLQNLQPPVIALSAAASVSPEADSNVPHIPRDESSELANTDQDSLAPECDRETISTHLPCEDNHGSLQLEGVSDFGNREVGESENSENESQPRLQADQVTVNHDQVEALCDNDQAIPEQEGDRGIESSPSPEAQHILSMNEMMRNNQKVAETGQTSVVHSNGVQSCGGLSHDSVAQSPSGSASHQQDPESVSHSGQVQSSQSHSELSTPLSAQAKKQPNNSIPSLGSNNSASASSSSACQDQSINDKQEECGINISLTGASSNGQDPQSLAGFSATNLSPSGSSSQSSTPTISQQTSPAKKVEAALSQALAMDSDQISRELAIALHSDDEDELMSELDAALLARTSLGKCPKISHESMQKSPQPSPEKLPEVSSKNNTSVSKVKSGQTGKYRQGEKEAQLMTANGLQPSIEMRQLQEHNRQLLDQIRIRDEEIARLTQEKDSQRKELSQAKSKFDEQYARTAASSSHSADDLYLPQIKELENTIAEQQNEIKAMKDKLMSHDHAAKRAVTTLQNELKSRVDKVTKMYEDCLKEKDMMVVRFAESEAKNMEAKRIAERSELKVKEAMRDRDNMLSALKAAKADRQKAVSNFDSKCAEIGNLHKELEKMKEAVNSSEYRIKWFQNKLKEELEAHKETKANLEKTTAKLKEAREETEVIRKECQAIVKRYQESEEIKSNSLDKELKMKESELRTQLQERNDTEEIHQMTKKELDSLKSQHKDTIEEAKTFKDKVQCLEEERQQNHRMIENYQEIMQRQKTENAELKSKITSLSTLDDDYKRAQEMINTLDKDVADLKVTNRDLQKDMESCRERESKMLSLQSELSRTNALLRSENTNLSNKASILTVEVEKMKIEVHELQNHVKDLSCRYEEEKARRIEEVEKMSTALAERTKECNEFKQKWEDEIDSSKTLKRRHANNVKDLTRQLQQVRRKLENLEGKGDAGSMGSRTNSNGSLNSVENSNTQQHQHATHQAPVQEFPVITEQVEVDKNVLIERIVRLQKSHARKNEKLEFLGEHIQQLLEEIKKKNKIIQMYALREEAGALSSEDMDANKTEVQKELQHQLARKGGIMASVYSVHQQDGNMTLELSLQINKKLQAVLEDTLLKNITLKENLDTLGEEIARLSQENRQLQLHLQEIENR